MSASSQDSQKLTLQDGQEVAYAVYGSQGSTTTIVYHHGFPGSRLEAAALHYETQQEGLGTALLAEVEKTFGRISELPLAARTIRGDLRRRLVHRFPYYILYRVKGDDVLVVAVATVAVGQVIGVTGYSHIISRCTGQLAPVTALATRQQPRQAPLAAELGS